MKYKSKQEVFDKAIAHLKTMKGRSMQGNSCAYRGKDDQKCIVGGLIPDKLYDEEMDCTDNNTGIEDLWDNSPCIRELFNNDEDILVMLDSLQVNVHDREYNWGDSGYEEWGVVKEIANRYNLEFNHEI